MSKNELPLKASAHCDAKTIEAVAVALYKSEYHIRSLIGVELSCFSLIAQKRLVSVADELRSKRYKLEDSLILYQKDFYLTSQAMRRRGLI